MKVVRRSITALATIVASALLGTALASADTDVSKLPNLVEQAAITAGATERSTANAPRVSESGSLRVGSGSTAIEVLPIGEFTKTKNSNGHIVNQGPTLDYVTSTLETGETRFAAVIKSAQHDHPAWEFPHDVRLLVVDGRVTIATPSGEMIAGIDAPWAVDADGRKLNTHYKVDGSRLIQIVETDHHTVFPVVADPTVVQYPLYLRVNLNRSESIAVLTGLTTCAAVFSKSPHWAGKALTISCAALAALGGPQVLGNNKCISIHVVGVTPPLGTWWPTLPNC